jgi:hypothetical protein
MNLPDENQWLKHGAVAFVPDTNAENQRSEKSYINMSIMICTHNIWVIKLISWAVHMA